MFNLKGSAYGITMALNSGGLAEGTNANTLQAAVAFDYAIDGLVYTEAITDNIAMTACATQAALTSCLYLVSINAAGAHTVTKGRDILTADLASGKDALQWPACPEANCPWGGFRVATAAATTFTSGTTDLSAAGITDTYYQLATVPADSMTA